MKREDETAPSVPPGCQCGSGVDLLREPSPGEFGGGEGEDVVVGVLDWARGLLHLSPDSPLSPLGLLEHTSRTDCPCHDLRCAEHAPPPPTYESF